MQVRLLMLCLTANHHRRWPLLLFINLVNTPLPLPEQKTVKLNRKRGKWRRQVMSLMIPSASTQVGMKEGQRRSRLLRSQPRTGYHPKSSFAVKSKKTAAASSSNGRTVNSMIITRKKKVNEDDEDEFMVKKGPLKTHSKSALNEPRSKRLNLQ